MRELKKYDITTVRDFLEVPPDRLPYCLQDFYRCLEEIREDVAREPSHIGHPRSFTFNWADDGARADGVRVDDMPEHLSVSVSVGPTAAGAVHGSLNMAEERINLGEDHWLTFYSWSPDRELNPHYAGLADVERYGAQIDHKKPDGRDCWSAVTFEGDVQQVVSPATPAWKVVSWEPLSLAPSILCRICGDHGFIREGKWIRA